MTPRLSSGRSMKPRALLPTTRLRTASTASTSRAPRRASLGPISDGTNTPTNDTAAAFDGQSGLVTSANQVPYPGPQTFSIELWFKTTTEEGGKLIGFGSNQTGMSSSYDRHIYMMNDGQLVFGVWTGSTTVIETPDVYNDGQWHYVVATIGPSGMAMYVDGQLVGTNSNTTVQDYAGYWRVGGDNLNAWNLDEWGANSQGFTEPNSYYFNGDIADVAVYPAALSAAEVAAPLCGQFAESLTLHSSC